MPSSEIKKGRMTRPEREIRSKLAQLVSGAAFIRGTLTTRQKVCGKSTCKCARGKKHVALYLMASKDGKMRQLYVPRVYEARVRKWLEQYRKVEAHLEQISDLCWQKVQDREE